MEIGIHKVTKMDNYIVHHLFQLFSYDISDLSGVDIRNDGKYNSLDDIDDYSSKSNYQSYFIKVDGILAGIAVIRFEDELTYLRHYFILRKFQGKKVGFHAACKIFSMYTGKWRVSTMDYNKPAIKFWRKV